MLYQVKPKFNSDYVQINKDFQILNFFLLSIYTTEKWL